MNPQALQCSRNLAASLTKRETTEVPVPHAADIELTSREDFKEGLIFVVEEVETAVAALVLGLISGLAAGRSDC